MKQFKDPIYGYIDIENEYIPLIDSAEFQHLRNIRQTGYASLYPSALHNRFVHSLGVFYLGKKAFLSFKENVKDKYGNAVDWDEVKTTFELACLLHDIGHSPFSHTGEQFYNQSTKFIEEIHVQVHSEELESDMELQGWGKPHEAMSAIVGLKLLEEKSFKGKYNKELFARSIMGVIYEERHDSSVLLNAIICMLNGKVIDVDKIDYLQRDAYVTGYSTMAIDYERLLAGYTISTYHSKGREDREVEVAAYKKKSLSVIENIVQANDLEKRWVQSNPVILYDCRLIEMAIIKYNDFMMKKKTLHKKYKNIFNLQALSKKGFPAEDKVSLCLLSDEDIIYYLKNIEDSEKEEIKEQYFERGKRYKPLWKDETEFDELVAKQISQSKLYDFYSCVRDAVSFPESIFFLNETELRERKKRFDDTNEESIYPSALEKAIKILDLFYKFSLKTDLDFKFAIIKGTAFESNYQSFENAKGLFIELDEKNVIRFKDTLTVKATSENEQENLFHIYTTIGNIEKCGGRQKLRALLTEFINSEWIVRR